MFGGHIELPYLREIEINGALITSDGRWYYTGDLSAVEVEDPPTPTRYNEHDDDSDISFDTEDGDTWSGSEDNFRSGQLPNHVWRTKPDPQRFDPLMRLLVTAAFQMPNLQNLLFSVGTGKKTGFVEVEDYYGIGFEYAAVGAESWYWRNEEEDDTGLNRNRCYVVLKQRANWDVPEDIVTLCKQFVGETGDFPWTALGLRVINLEGCRNA